MPKCKTIDRLELTRRKFALHHMKIVNERINKKRNGLGRCSLPRVREKA